MSTGLSDCYNPKMGKTANHQNRLSIAALLLLAVSTVQCARADEPLCHDLHAKQTVLNQGQESLRGTSYGSKWSDPRAIGKVRYSFHHDVGFKNAINVKNDAEPDEKALRLAQIREIEAKFSKALTDCKSKNYSHAVLEYSELHYILEQANIGDDGKLRYLEDLGTSLTWMAKENGQAKILSRVNISIAILKDKMRKSQCLTMAAKLNETADKLEKAGEYTMAHKLYQEALDIKEKNLGPNAPETAMQILNLARTAGEEKHYTEAAAQFERAIALLKQRADSADKSDLRNALQNYGQLLNEMKQEKKAEVIYNEARQLAKK